MTSRVIGDRLPDWMFGLFLAGLARRGRPRRRSRSGSSHDIGRNATAALAAGMALLVVVTLRGAVEILIAAGVLGVGARRRDVPRYAAVDQIDRRLVAPQITALAVGRAARRSSASSIVDGFRRMVQVELDRVLVQSTVSAPRFAVGMLASEELARLDLAAEELLDVDRHRQDAAAAAPQDGLGRGIPRDRAAPAPHRGPARDLALPRDHRVRAARQGGHAHRQVQPRRAARPAAARRPAVGGLAAGRRHDQASNASRTVTVQLGPVAARRRHRRPSTRSSFPSSITTTGVRAESCRPGRPGTLSAASGEYTDSHPELQPSRRHRVPRRQPGRP